MNDITVVPLIYSNAICLIDSNKADEILKYKWKTDGQGYVYRTRRNPKPRIIYLHKVILKVSPGFEVDHINKNLLDNRLCNLRECTHQQNCLNRGKQRGQYSSKYKGVFFDKRRKKFAAYGTLKGKVTYLKYCKSEIEAAKLSNNFMREQHKEYASLNILD